MRRWIAMLAFPLVGCPAPYGVRLVATVPVEVQAFFSASQPGLVMHENQVVALLCDPSQDALKLEAVIDSGNLRCERPQKTPVEAYAFRLMPTDLQSLSVRNRQSLTCGESHGISAGSVINAVAVLVDDNGLGVENRVASGAADGACAEDGNWQVELTLAVQSQP